MRLAWLSTLSCCVSVPPPVPPPLVELRPAEGRVLSVDVFRLPEGVAWIEVEAECAKGVMVPGDIALVDRRADPAASGQPCFCVAWTNGLPQRWKGCGGLSYPNDARYRFFELSGVWAARALVGTFDMHPAFCARVLGEVGWYDEAVSFTERWWVWCWATRGSMSMGPLLEAAVGVLPPDRQRALHESLTAEALEQGREGAESGDGWAMHRAAFKLVYLAKQPPAGATAASFTRRVRGMGRVDEKTYTKVIRNLRATLVAERAYDDALAGDPDPIGGFLDEAFWSGMATGVARAFPSGLIPAPSTATAAEKWAIKEGAILMQHEDRRKQGLVLYEALVGAGRTADADRLKRELKERYPVKPLPRGDSPEGEALRRLMDGMLPPGDLESRLHDAEARAIGAPVQGTPSQ